MVRPCSDNTLYKCSSTLLSMIHLMSLLPARTLEASLAILKQFTSISVMGCPVYAEGLSSDDALEVTKPNFQPLCSLCELKYTLFEILHRIICGMDVNPSDLQAYRVVAGEILLRDNLLHLNPCPEHLTAARQAICEVQRTSCSFHCTWEQTPWWGEVFENLKAGSKRGLREFQQYVGEYLGSSIPEGSSKTSKHLAHPVHKKQKKWPGECGGGGSNPNSKHLNGEECNISTHVTTVSNCYKDKSQYNLKNITEEVISMPSLDVVPGNQNSSTLTSAKSSILDALRNLPGLRTLLSKEKRIVSAQRKKVEVPSEAPIGIGWGSLPTELQENILQRVEFKDLFRFKTLSKSCKEYIESDAFSQWRGARSRTTPASSETGGNEESVSQGGKSSPEGLFTAINYYIKDKVWQCTGFDLHLRIWRTLPTFSPAPPAPDAKLLKENSICSPKLPAPDAELFKEYSVCGHGGLMCADVSKLPHKGKLVVFNPLTRKTFALPPLLYPRSPVLVHMSVDSKTKSYKVIVAGSSTASDEHLSKKMEVFDSKTAKWEEASDLPGPAFGLNEHQTGVCVGGVLYFISFLEGNSCRGVVAFDVQNGKWLDNMACPIPFSMYSNTLQLVQNDGKVYLFTEQERAGSVEHCIDVLEISSPNAGAVEKCHWRNVVRVKKSGGRGLQVYPESICVEFGKGKLCIFNTLNRDGVVYDMQDGKEVEVLQPPPPDQKGDNFFSLNPASFTLEPRFDSDPIPSIVEQES